MLQQSGIKGLVMKAHEITTQLLPQVSGPLDAISTNLG